MGVGVVGGVGVCVLELQLRLEVTLRTQYDSTAHYDYAIGRVVRRVYN